jgi:5-formyltetrahydrofolate cyclo-ligase
LLKSFMRQTIESNKAPLRQHLRQRRQQLNSSQRSHYARNMARHFQAFATFKGAVQIGLYLAADGEAEPHPIVRQLWRQGKQVYLPSIQSQQQLCFKPYRPASRLVASHYQIKEPGDMQGQLPAKKLDLLIMPLVAFDNSGSRLGMGGGYYDRHLAYRHANPRAAPLLVGLAYEFQRQVKLATDPWDIPLDLVITERGVSDLRPYSRKRR